jgi:hypothetical protein
MLEYRAILAFLSQIGGSGFRKIPAGGKGNQAATKCHVMVETLTGTGVQKSFGFSQISSRIKLKSFVHIGSIYSVNIPKKDSFTDCSISNAES